METIIQIPNKEDAYRLSETVMIPSHKYRRLCDVLQAVIMSARFLSLTLFLFTRFDSVKCARTSGECGSHLCDNLLPLTQEESKSRFMY